MGSEADDVTFKRGAKKDWQHVQVVPITEHVTNIQIDTNKGSYETEFWKITHMGAPETIRIFQFSMALFIPETTFKNISKL